MTEHKAVQRRCGNCRSWFHGDPSREEGQCRFNPPVPILTSSARTPTFSNMWPRTHPDDWCEQFQAVADVDLSDD